MGLNQKPKLQNKLISQMDRIVNFARSHTRSLIILAFFALTAAIIVYLLPREGKFMYEYQKGGFWKHEDLTAPFNFPVNKSREEITREQDSVLKSFRPVFMYDAKVAEQRIQELNEDFSAKWVEYSLNELKIPSRDLYRTERKYLVYRQLENEYRMYLASLVRDIYRSGIIDVAPIQVDGKVAYSEVIVVKDNVAETHVLSDLYTPRSAYEYVAQRLKNSVPKRVNLPVHQYAPFFQNFQVNNYLSINVVYDAERSSKLRVNLSDGISLTRGLIQEGQAIISRGEVITEDKFLILESLRQEYEKNLGSMARQLVILGKFILVFTSLVIIFLFMRSVRRQVLNSYTRVTFILLTMVLMILVSTMTLKFSLVSIYLLPFTILPIILKTFYDTRLALFIHIITILLIGFFAPNGFEFVFLNIMAGIVALISLTNVYRRSRLVVTAIYVIITYSVVYLGIALIQEGSIANIELRYFRWFGVNGMLILISYPLIYMFEKIFGFMSDATLMELTDTNQPLLRRLAELAPGTFQHSLQVANLAEDAVYQVGGNTLLVRAGALYHDIGKMDQPLYYIENQTTGINPHDNLEFEQSARIIIDHVRNGVELAKKYKLPEAIVDFIRTHHGTSTVQYFYRSYLRQYPEAEVDVRKFSYPGPRPMSKETAIVMMADSVEAASRSLKTIDENSLDRLVDSIISTQMTEEQYNEAQITFKDITLIREVFKKRLRNIYHVRISYPS
jgi:cyclic-di-AMP phosphodiesterase PgpH